MLHKEILFAGIAGLTATLAILAMPHLVAAPKVLFGRSLSAIEPSLFPYVTLALTVLISASLILLNGFRAKRATTIVEQHPDRTEPDAGWMKTVLFFVLLTVYGLLLKPVGFLISSFLVISATSVMLGNRNWLQILLLALLAPICLYLLATRAMLVSLPELNAIELWYAQAINWASSNTTP